MSDSNIGKMFARQLDILLDIVSTKPLKLSVRNVHKGRVASRRLREVLKNHCLDESKQDSKAVKKVKKFADSLSNLRDADVQLKFLGSFSDDIADGQKQKVSPGIKFLKKQLKKIRSKHEKRARERIRKLEITETLSGIRNRLLPGYALLGEDNKSLLLEDRVRDNMVKRLDKVAVSQKALQYPEDTVLLHKMRIALKKLRYCLEFYSQYKEDDLSDFIDKIKYFQDITGQIHDLDQWPARIKSLESHVSNEEINYGVKFLEESIFESRDCLFENLVKDWGNLIDDNFWNDLISFVNLKGFSFERE